MGFPVNGRGRRHRLAAGTTACVAVAFAAALAGGDGGWRRAGERDGIVVEQRPVAGSPFLEVRASGRSPLPPPAVLETVWNHREYVQFVPYLKRLDVLREGPDWLLVYEQVSMPLASDRDYTIRLQRTAAPDTGRLEVTFRSAPGEGPPESAPHVRVAGIEGSWVIEPEPGGGTRAAYAVHNDPGGAIPAWLVNRLQVTVTAEFVRAMLARAEARRP
jgi:ribosome-associated toxin RatA of RatAB toxin-antitoxin module